MFIDRVRTTRLCTFLQNQKFNCVQLFFFVLGAVHFVVPNHPEDAVGERLAGMLMHVESAEQIFLDPDASDYHATLDHPRFFLPVEPDLL